MGYTEDLNLIGGAGELQPGEMLKCGATGEIFMITLSLPHLCFGLKCMRDPKHPGIIKIDRPASNELVEESSKSSYLILYECVLFDEEVCFKVVDELVMLRQIILRSKNLS